MAKWDSAGGGATVCVLAGVPMPLFATASSFL